MYDCVEYAGGFSNEDLPTRNIFNRRREGVAVRYIYTSKMVASVESFPREVVFALGEVKYC